MKSVLISIRPKWCELIVSGEKTIEVRKTRPKIETPFKCYIYCTMGDVIRFRGHRSKATKNTVWLGKPLNNISPGRYTGNGMVIGEFVCDKTERFSVGSLRSDDIEKLACLSYNEMISYFYKPEELDGKTAKQGFAWHISNLKIYDKPKDLSEFYVHKYDRRDYCDGCVHHECPLTEYPCCECIEDEINRAYLYRPPQSWIFVEEV